jgi:hypothetical protein
MKKVLLTTSAIIGLTAPVFAADPTAVSDQPYFHHSHPMTWSGSMAIAVTNLSNSDSTDAIVKGGKKNWMFSQIMADKTTAGDIEDGDGVTGLEEILVGNLTDDDGAAAVYNHASNYMSAAANNLAAHASLTAVTTDSSVEDIIDDYFGGSFSEAMDVLDEVHGNGGTDGLAPTGSDIADVADDLKAFQAAQDAGVEGVETTSSINTSASLGVAMSAGDGWTAKTSGTINLGAGSVAGGTLSMSNGVMTVAVGKSQHSAKAAVATVFGMDRSLNSNAADTTLSATLAMGGATISVDNELDGDNLEMKGQTVGIKGSYGTMSYGLGWEAEGDVGFSIGTNLGQIGLTVTRVNTGSTYSMGLGAVVDLGGGMKLNASNAQNSDGLTDVNFNYSAISGAASAAYTTAAAADSIGTILQARAVHKSISTVGLTYAGGGNTVSVSYREKAGTSSTGDNLIASGSMTLSPTITLTGAYDKDAATTTLGASGPIGSAGTLSALMTSTGSSSITASFKF